MSLIQFLRILNARRLLILAILLFGALAGTIAALTLPARYEGRARLMLDIVKPDPVTGTIIATQFVRAYTRTQIELISDYRTAGRVVQELGWLNDPAKIDAYNAADVGDTEDMQHWLARRIIDRTEASLLEGSNILEITYDGRTPAESKQMAGLLRSAFVQESLQFRRNSAQRTADWYREQADEALRRLNGSETARADYAKQNGIVLTGNNVDLETARLQTLSQQSAIAAGAGSGVVITGGGGGNPAQAQLDALDARIGIAAANLGPNHPQLIALKQERTALAASVARGGGGGRVSTGPNIGQINSAFEAQKQRLINQRDKIDRLAQMQSDVDLLRGQYQKTAQRAADLQLEADVGEAGMTALGESTASETVSFPNRPLLIAGGIGGGLVLGLMLAIALEVFKRKIRMDRDLETASGAPVFAIVGARQADEGGAARLLAYLDRRRGDRAERGA